MSYRLLASECPPPAIPGAFLSIPNATQQPNMPPAPNTTGGNAPVGTGLIAGERALSAPFNELATRTANLARYGAGARGVGSGMTGATAASLNLPVAQGHVVFDNVQQYAAQNVGALPDNTDRIFIYAQQNGTLTWRATPDVIANAVYIMNVKTQGGQIVLVDYSGVVYASAIGPIRYVKDVNFPTDTPPASWVGWTVGQSLIWWQWTGTAYNIVDSVNLTSESIPAGASVAIPQGYQYFVIGPFAVHGHLNVHGRLIVRS